MQSEHSTNYNRVEILRILQKTHSLYYEFWRRGKPIFVEDGSVGTAAVSVDKTGKYIKYYWEKSFWESLNDYERAFVISHEMSHLLLSHLKRWEDLPYKKIANLAQDCVINEMLVNDFGFDPDKIGPWKKIATFDSVFPIDKYPNLDRTHCFEYYYQLLVDNAEKIEVDSIDNHEMFGDTDLSDVIDVDWESFEGEISSEEWQHAKGPGKDEGNETIQVEKTYSRECKGWLKAIKRWKDDFGDVETSQWIKPNRRIQSLPDGIFLPSMDTYDDIVKKPNVWVFVDVSLSCIKMVPDFLKAARTIPKTFNVKYFSFDVKVKEIDPLSDKFAGGGGTELQPIEDTLIKAKKYPDHIWVLSDGEFQQISPRYPARWTFFLGGYAYTEWLPTGSNFYLLKDIIK